MRITFNPISGQFDFTGKSVGSSEKQLLESVAVTIVSTNVWQTVPLAQIVIVADADVYDQANEERVELDLRIVSNTQVQIRSNKIKTFTVRVEGYV